MSYIVHLRKKLRLIGQYAMPLLMVAAMIASPGSGVADIVYSPHSDTFENYTNGTPLVEGTNGWHGSSSDIIVTNIVCTNYGVVKTNAAMIPVDSTLSNRWESSNSIGIWMQIDANLAFYNDATPPPVDTNVSAMFYINSNGYFVVHNGAFDPTPTNSINWVTLQTNVAGQPITQLTANTSARINLRHNYEHKNWALYADTVLLTNNIGFINTTLTNFMGFDLYNGNTTSFLENVHVREWWTEMEVSPTNINHTIWQGHDAGTNLVAVWNGNGTNDLVFSTSVSYTNCDGFESWLVMTNGIITNNGASPKSYVSVFMNTTNLLPRTNAYEGFIYVIGAQPGTTNSPQVVRVTVSVRGVALWVSPTNLTNTVTLGQVNVFDKFMVANTGTPPRDAMTYTVTTNQPWLSVSPPSGWVIDNMNTVVVTYATAGLSAGTHTGQVDVIALGVRTQAVNVVLQVNNRPGAAWNAADPYKVWTNEVILGSSLAGTNVAVWNASGEPRGQMSYDIYVINDPFGWVSVNPATGISTGDQKVVAVSYATTGLVAGVYTAQLVVEGTDVATGEPATNGPLSVTLKLTVLGSGPVLKTDVTSLNQTVLENFSGTNNFRVWNEGKAPRGGMRYTVTKDAGWVTVIPATGVVTNDVMTNQVVWGDAGLSPGTHPGHLTVTAVDAKSGIEADGSPLVISLTLTVTPRTPENLEKPTIVGTLYIGQTVEVNVGIWRNQERLTFGPYQWERATDKSGVVGHEVLGIGMETNYMITQADRGKYLRVGVTATDPGPPALSSVPVYSEWVNAKVKALPADFNGDGITDLWFYDELSGMWHMNFGTDNSVAGIFGGPGMLATPGDFDGDGYEDVAVYESARGMWHILCLPRGDYFCGSLMGGTVYEAEATPVPADYDGDGATDVAFYWMGYWIILYSSSGSVEVVEPFTSAWGEPMTGDWDGNGVDEMGVYQNGVWTIRLANGSVVVEAFGGGGDSVLPAPGDYDGDGATDLGVHDVNANQWRWRSSWTGSNMIENSFGPNGGEPTQGYYDHDRKEDFAQAFLYDDDFIVWIVKRTTEHTVNPDYPYLYHGQSYQLSTDLWRVSW